MKRVTGIGGIFFNAKDPAALRSASSMTTAPAIAFTASRGSFSICRIAFSVQLMRFMHAIRFD